MLEVCDQVAENVSAYVHRRNRSHDPRDAYQDAWVSLLSFGMPNYDASRGVPFRLWAWRTALRPALWSACRKNRDHLRREELELKVAKREPESNPEDAAHLRRWRKRVLVEVRRVLGEPGLRPECVQIVMGLSRAEDVANRLGITRREAMQGSRQVRQRLARSPELRALWEERP